MSSRLPKIGRMRTGRPEILRTTGSYGSEPNDQNSGVRPGLHIDDGDIAMLDGERGEGPRVAMGLVIGAAKALGAERLLDITGAHIDGCLYHGQASLDFALRLVEAGAKAAVPTTLNVSTLDLLHPERFRGIRSWQHRVAGSWTPMSRWAVAQPGPVPPIS